MSTGNNTENNQNTSDIEQAVDDVNVEELSKNLADDASDASEDTNKPASLDTDENTAFIDEELRTDK